jgi:hypothetical protein
MLAFEPTRKIFISRALRLLFFTSLALALNFFLSLAIPVWMLALGPLVFGATHLFSSLRFVPKAISDDQSKQSLASRLMIVFVLAAGGIRFLQTHFSATTLFGLNDGWEMVALFASFVCLSVIFGLRKKLLFFSTIQFALIAVCSWYFPLVTAAVLMIGHNFVPFFYWMKMSKSTSERNVAIFSLFIFSLIHLLILSGWTDGFAHRWSVADPHFGPLLDPFMIAKQVFPTSSDFLLLGRALSVFAFGQAVHYFLWIKVIPEESLRQEVPQTFTQLKKTLVQDLGLSLSIMASVLAIGFIGAMFFMQVGLLRELYITGVAAHGYAELAGLPFLFMRRS